MSKDKANVDIERKVQNRVIGWLVHDLEYKYLGNLEDEDNPPIKEDLLRKNLLERGYSERLIAEAVRRLTNAANNGSDKLTKVNADVYSLLRYGSQGVKDTDGSRPSVHYIDWKNIGKNDFYVAEEVSVLCFDRIHRKRPDIVLYVNGIALGVFELKRSCVSLGEGIRQMLTNQKQENIGAFFATAQLLFAGNEAEGLRYGVIETPEKYWLKWKEDMNATDTLSGKIKELQGDGRNRLRNGIISLCQQERFLSLIYDFMIFDAGIKKTARHNQYFANIAARQRIRQGEGGIIWNTQGSGKSLIMVWLAKWIIENLDGSRVVIITDRDELDDQIESLFINVDEKDIRRTKSGADLRDILNVNDARIICSLIHKYGHNAGKDADIDLYIKKLTENLPKDYEAKGNIVAFIDECHRTNSGKLHEAVKVLMPNAVLIGFTGTPLMKRDKKKSIEIFGPYIHTYKFNEGVEDGVVLDLRYEARDIDQELTGKDKADKWFEEKTKGLTERAKTQLKQSWTTLNRLYSSKQRLEKIAADIIYDMGTKPRLQNDRGTAMLVAGSIYEACKYWDIFTSNNFTKCAVVTSYDPKQANVRTATSNLDEPGEEERKKEIYTRMLNGKSIEDFETEAKKLFKEQPAKMKLLIVVDKLLTGFDAPSATYMYIDKKMQDHDLFQAICRVNRPDGDDKDYGYIVDYMDLFRSVQKAIADYTSGAFDEYDKEDVEGLIKNRYDEAEAEMRGSFAGLQSLMENVDEPKADEDYIAYFCGVDEEEAAEKEQVERRETLYKLVASLSRSFAECCDRLVSHYGYTEEGVENHRERVDGYNRVKDMIRLASCDYVDLKPYESDMRYILDTYIRADESRVLSALGNMSLIELLLDGKTTTPASLVHDLPGSKGAKAETIENNLRHEITKKFGTNDKTYQKLSEMLQNVIKQRKTEAITYEEYLRQVTEIAQATMHPEEDDSYPEDVRDSAAKRRLYDFLGENASLAVKMDAAIRDALEPGYQQNAQKQRQILLAIGDELMQNGFSQEDAEEKADAIFEIVQGQAEYQ